MYLLNKISQESIYFNQIGHVGLIEHTDSGNFSIIGHSNSTDTVVSSTDDLTGASKSIDLNKQTKKKYII